MAINVQSFSIDQVIIHDVPSNDGTPADDAVVLSEAVVPDLDASRRNFFQERINRSLLGRAFIVEHDPDQPSHVPDLVATILGDAGTLVDASQEVATALYVAQSRVNNPGLLVVISGRLGAEPCVCILKLQRHEGMRMEQTEVDGQKTFSATILDDLTLTEDTKVFKAALFRADAPRAVELDGLVSDDQRGYDARIDVANFFLRTFLGCRLKTAADIATKQFYDVSADFIATVQDPETRLKYAAALSVELSRPAATVVPTDFANQYLETADRQPYIAHLADHGIPEAAIDKDTARIVNRLRKTTLITGKKIRIVGAPDVLNELVRYEPADGDQPARIVITDSVEDIRAG